MRNKIFRFKDNWPFLVPFYNFTFEWYFLVLFNTFRKNQNNQLLGKGVLGSDKASGLARFPDGEFGDVEEHARHNEADQQKNQQNHHQPLTEESHREMSRYFLREVEIIFVCDKNK